MIFGVLYTGFFPCQWYGGLLKKSPFNTYYPAHNGQGHCMTEEEAIKIASNNYKFYLNQESVLLMQIAKEFIKNKRILKNA